MAHKSFLQPGDSMFPPEKNYAGCLVEAFVPFCIFYQDLIQILSKLGMEEIRLLNFDF